MQLTAYLLIIDIDLVAFVLLLERGSVDYPARFDLGRQATKRLRQALAVSLAAQLEVFVNLAQLLILHIVSGHFLQNLLFFNTFLRAQETRRRLSLGRACC